MGIDKMIWKNDLTRDIRTNTAFDDQDAPIGELLTYGGGRGEFTPENRESLEYYFSYVKEHCTAILEIGVCRNGDDSSTHVFLRNKKPETIYIGIDLDDKTFLNDPANNVYTIRANSSDIESNMEQIKKLGVTSFEFIFIDGLHSINQVLTDWEYTKWLADNGVVSLHDVTSHPGPHAFMKALDKNKWNLEENTTPFDYGIGFAWRK